MTWRLPNFDGFPDSPEIADGFVGVALAFPKRIDVSIDAALPIFGAFQIPEDVMSALPGQDPYRALVVLLIDANGFHPYSFNPAGQAIMLERAKSPPGMFRGYFNVDAFRMAQTEPRAGRFFVSAYLDIYRTPSLLVEVSGTSQTTHHGHQHHGR